MLKWIDFPPIAEFTDRRGIARSIRGCTLFGRFEFSDRMAGIQEILDKADESIEWTEIYRQSERFRHSIAAALGCWGIEVEWLSENQIEQLLFRRGSECGWLVELATANSPPRPVGHPSQGGTLEESIAAIATHCGGLMEALDLAGNVPADLLVGVLRAKNDTSESADKTVDGKMGNLRENFDKIMGKFEEMERG